MSGVARGLAASQCRERWLHFKTLAHYIQELGCINILDQLDSVAKARVQRLAALAEAACSEVVVMADLFSKVRRLLTLLAAKQRR